MQEQALLPGGDLPPFADQLRRHRLAAQLTQEALAERAGLSVDGLSKLERGLTQPQRETLERLVTALGLAGAERAVFIRARAPRPRERALDAGQHHLPLQLTSFIGRERELAEVEQALERTRLLTLTGTGGCGKTRLALQAATEVLERFPDGVWFVGLSPLADPALVPASVASVVGVREQPSQPIQQTLTAALRPKQLLLLLDNCEHLIAACAELAEAILRACPQVRLLATSRELLGVPGELTHRVPSLGLPDPTQPLDPEAALGSEAVRLFVERARLVRPDFALTAGSTPAVVAICRRLDGIPLAIELAAARLRVLSPEQLLSRLHDRFRLLTGGRTALRRQQTLQATIDWSHDLLSEAERALFRRLSVFVGGFTLEAAEAVTSGEDVAVADVLDRLTRLVDQSLVQVADEETATRYRLLETIRQYAEAKLLAAGEAVALRDRHAAYYLERAERDRPVRPGEGFEAMIRRKLREDDNQRAALAWHLERADAERALRLGNVLLQDWFFRGRLGEVHTLLTALLALPAGSGLAEARAGVLFEAGRHAQAQGDYTAARSRFEQSITIWRACGDRRGLARSLSGLGQAATEQGDYNAAQAALEEALALARKLDLHRFVQRTTTRLGELAQARGDFWLARSLYEQALAMDGAMNAGESAGWWVRQATAFAAHGLAWLFLEQGDDASARAWLSKGLLTYSSTPYPSAKRAGLALAAALAAAEGRRERAMRLAGKAADLAETHGFVLPPTTRRLFDHWLEAARRALGEEAAARAAAAGCAMTDERAIAEALAEDSDG